MGRISGASIFSVSDLGGPETYLYGVYKYRKVRLEVELLEENSDSGMTYCRVRGSCGNSDYYEELKTNRIKELYHSDKKIW